MYSLWRGNILFNRVHYHFATLISPRPSGFRCYLYSGTPFFLRCDNASGIRGSYLSEAGSRPPSDSACIRLRERERDIQQRDNDNALENEQLI